MQGFFHYGEQYIKIMANLNTYFTLLVNKEPVSLGDTPPFT